MSMDIAAPATERDQRDEDGESLIRRALNSLRDAWQDAPQVFNGAGDRATPHGGVPDLAQCFRRCLAAPGGEVSARARAVEMAAEIVAMDDAGRMRTLRLLAGEFAAPPALVDSAMAAVRDARTAGDRRRAERALFEALETPGRKLLQQFNGLPDGMKLLVDLRAQLLAEAGGDSALKSLEVELSFLLRSWFDIGFLELRRITWESPASQLEKLIAYEAVHEIKGWGDLERRLADDRRCYGYFHPPPAG
jgi:malonyl-CoA decarboxylase